MNRTIMQVNYGETSFNSYGNKTVDDMCRMAAEIGFDGIEFRCNPPKNFENQSVRDYVEQISRGKKKYGLSTILFGVGIPQCSNPNKEERQKSIAEAIEKAKIFNDLCGTTVANCFASIIKSPIPTAPEGAVEFCGSFAATPEQWKLTADSFHQLGMEAEKMGMKFAIETHNWYIHDLPNPTVKLIEMIDSPAIGINMDYGNTVKFPNRPSVAETIDIYGDKLIYVHLKNSVMAGNERISTALGEGEINHREYIAKLKEIGYNGPIVLECTRPGDREYFAKQDFEYYKSVAASL